MTTDDKVLKLINTKFGKKIYKELLKIYVLTFKEFPSNVPEDILQEIKSEVNATQKNQNQNQTSGEIK